MHSGGRGFEPHPLHQGSGRYAVTCLGIIVAWLGLTTPWWLHGLAIPWDSQNHFYPMLRGLARHLAQGDWPAWIPETYGGRPSLADPQSMVVHPGFLALAWLDAAPSLRAMDTLVLAHLLLGALALAALGLRRGAHPLAAILGALVFAFGGAAMARLQHTLLVLSYAWLPLALLAVELMLDRPSWRRGLLAGAVVAGLTLNRDHVAFLGHLPIAAAAIARLGGSTAPWRALRAALPATSLAVAVWLLLIGLPLLASIAYVAQSSRPSFDAHFVGGVEGGLVLPWASLLTLPFPNLFLTLTEPSGYWGPASPGWLPAGIDRGIVQLALGIAPAVMLLWLGVLRGGFLRPGARFGAAVALLALLFAVGERAPVFRAVYELVPGFDLYRRPADASFLVNLGLALALLAIADRYLREGLAPVPPWRRLVEGLAGLAVVATALAVASARGQLASAWPAVLGPTLLGIVTVGLLVLGARGDGRRRALAMSAILAITLVDLALHNAGTPINARPATEAAPLEDPAADPLGRWLGERLAAIEASDGRMRVELLGLGGAWQNAPLVLGIDATLGYNPLRSSAYDTAVGTNMFSHLPERAFGTLMTGYSSPFADILGLRYVVLGAPMAAIDPGSAALFPPPLRIGDAYVYDNVDAVPRLVLVDARNVRPHDPAVVLESGDLPAFDGRRDALVAGAAAPSTAPAAVPPGSLAVLHHGPDRVHVEVDLAHPAWLVFHELADPGWAAYVEGRRRPLHRANVLFQAVRLEPGDRNVVLDYASWRAVAATFLP